MTTRRQFLKATAAASAISMAAHTIPALAKEPRFGVAGDDFMLDGHPFQILAGEMHYPRIPRASWRDRFRKLKALGLNTLSTYVFWNAHEVKPGQFDFSGNLDIAAYIRLAQEEGLYVTLRPGPYVCAEWDGGGYPAWLFPTPDLTARSLDPRYMKPMRRWMKRLGQELAPLLIDNGGPIILTQIENEYGAYGSDQAYLAAQTKILREAGFSGALYTADPSEFFANGSIPGVIGGINFGTKAVAANEFAARAKVRREGPYFCSELWGGWFDSFGKLHDTMPIPPLIDSLKWMLDQKYSFSFYMLHGGTSFGFTAGANWNDQGYQPNISSYDYDALLDEAGRPTAKYRAIKALLENYLPPSAFAPMPEPEPSISLPRFRLGERAGLDQLLGTPRLASQPQSLEALGQTHGMMLYRHRSDRALNGELKFDDVRDFAMLRSGGELQGVINRVAAQTSAPIDIPAGGTVDILVDTMGHCNYGKNIGKDQKGLIGSASINGADLEGWEHFGLPLDDVSGLQFARGVINGPAFHRGHFDVEKPGFTYLDMRGWGKGYVWINGVNIGRYWSAGPQQANFVPGSLLKAGRNEIVVLDLFDEGDRSLASSPRQIWHLPGQNIDG